MGYRKKIVFHPPGGKNFVHVEDVAMGVKDALEKGGNGEAYLLCGENLSYREFFRKLCERTGERTRYVQVPGFLLRGAGYIGNLLRSVGIKNDFTLTNMRILCIHNYYSHRKASEQLGFRPRPVDDAIDDAVQWFVSKSMLPAEA